jgi:hypothetical protein
MTRADRGRASVRGRVRSLHPLAVGALAIVLAVAFATTRLEVAAHGDVTRFVVAGASFADAATLDPPLHVFDSAGYDGQFYWRMAVAPGAHELGPVHGMRVDQGIRFGRIGYPMVARALAGGRDDLVAWTLVGANLLGIGAIAAVVAAQCRRSGHHPLLGLLVAGSSGLVMALSRDLTEVLMVAALLAGMVALDRRRPWLATAGWSAAVLVHEQALVVIGAYAVARVVHLVRTRERPGAADVPWVVPAVVYAGWQLVCLAAWDQAPLAESGSKSLAAPFVGLAGLVRDWLSGDIARQEVLVPLQLLLVVALAVAALRTTLPAEQAWHRWAVGVACLLPVLLSYNVWKGPAELRQFVILPVVAWVVLVEGPAGPRRWLTGLAVVVTCATMALRVVAI